MTSTAATDPAPSSNVSIKRKLDEAFDALDDALHPREPRPSPKRANTSIYGSLAKYGIRSFNKPSSTSKQSSTPTLTALLSRSRSKKQRKPISVSQFSKCDGSSSVTPDYSPCSTEAFLQRLSTFSLSTYPSKPPPIDAVAASKAGWINEGGKDRVYCAICQVGWIVAGREGMSKDAANALVEKQRKLLVGMHKEGCPWRARQCDALVYRIPLQSPTGLARQIKKIATELEPVMGGIAIRHPLSSIQAQSFVQTVSSVPDGSSSDTQPTAAPSPDSPNTFDLSSPPSPTALLTALFGWSLVPPPPPLARVSSSANLTLARTHSRASSVQSIAGPSREGTPTPGAFGTPTPFSTPARRTRTPLPFSTPVNGNGKGKDPETSTPPPPLQKDAMLQCRMCQRRVGLWAFAVPVASNSNPSASPHPIASNSTAAQRHFDLLREHRSYCPYVVKSTPLPSLPSYPTAPPPTPRSSFVLNRVGTSSSLLDGQSTNGNGNTGFNLRRTTSLLSGASSLARMSPITPSAATQDLQMHALVEGWRAMLSVVLRYGIAERSRLRVPPPVPAVAPEPDAHDAEEDEVMSGVVALVEGVKQHGGKQLLSYVRGLLG